jgi:DNA primase catalytic subunit
LQRTFTENPPYAIYSGAIFEKPVIAYEKMRDAKVIATDLAFDIDIDAYDSERTGGCRGKQICDTCWLEFIVPSVKIIDDVLRNTYKYRLLLWTFSGGRGAHLRVMDGKAALLTVEERT